MGGAAREGRRASKACEDRRRRGGVSETMGRLKRNRPASVARCELMGDTRAFYRPTCVLTPVSVHKYYIMLKGAPSTHSRTRRAFLRASYSAPRPRVQTNSPWSRGRGGSVGWATHSLYTAAHASSLRCLCIGGGCGRGVGATQTAQTHRADPETFAHPTSPLSVGGQRDLKPW